MLTIISSTVSQQISEARSSKKALQNQALAQKQEYDAATPDARRMVASQIEQTFRDIDAKDQLLTMMFHKNNLGQRFTIEQFLQV